MKHDYYRLHAFVAGGLLTIVLTLQKLEIIKTETASIFALPLLGYLAIAIVLAFKSFSEGDEKKAMSMGNVEGGSFKGNNGSLSKDDAKVLKKLAKARVKERKKGVWNKE